MEGGKARTQRETLGAGMRTDNKFNPYVALTLNLNLGHSGGMRAL